MKINTKELTLVALFLALCIIIPLIFHFFAAGTIFLPMFIPILVSALILRFPYGLVVGVLGPYISSLTTGMPPLFPMAILMSVEGLFMAVVAGYLYRIRKYSAFLSVLFAMILDRMILFVMVISIAPLLGLPPKMFSLISILYSMPGVILQLVLVPYLVATLERSRISLLNY